MESLAALTTDNASKKFGFELSVSCPKDIIEKKKPVDEIDYYENPIDAARMGCFIYHVPYVSYFKEIYDYLDSENISNNIDPIIFSPF